MKLGTTRKCHFDAASHTYTLDGGVKVPSVTQIIGAVLPRTWDCDPWYMQRGTMLHKAVALMLHGELDWNSVDERIVLRVHAAEKFLSEYEVHRLGVLRIEERMCSSCGQFAGTPDLVAGEKTIVDWKSVVEPEAEIQLGGYAILAGITEGRAFAVETRDDGTYAATKYDIRRARQLFLNVLTVYQFMAKNGRIK